MQITPVRTNDSLRAITARRIRRFGWISVVAAVALSGCTAKKTEAPAVTGPSELGLSLELRATPDVVTMDGTSQSQIVVTARDSNGRPLGNQGVRVEVLAGGEIVDFGRLSTKNVTTGSDGQARLNYTAPAGAPSQNSDSFTVVRLQAVPTGYDFNNALMREVAIRLVPQGAILPKPYHPVARFTYSPTGPNEDANVIFDASSSIASCLPNPTDPAQCTRQEGEIVSYVWDFGNGRSATGVRATTQFSTSGTYVVRLTVTNDRNLTNFITSEVNVAAVAGPTAEFAFSPTSPSVNQNVFFDASAAAAASGRSVTRHAWNFGDGSSGSGRTASHRYSAQGTYAVTLTVTDDAGATGTVSKSVTVGEGLSPTAEFTVSPATVLLNQPVFFDGTASVAPAGRRITRYVWNLGDNTIVEGPRAQHSFSRAGTYTVLLTVTDSAGASDTISNTVTVTP